MGRVIGLLVGVAFVAAIAVVVLLVAGVVSARPGTCAAAVSVGPQMEVNSSAFVSAHEDTRVEVCAGGECRDATTGGTGSWLVFPDARVTPKTVTVTAKMTAPNREVARESKVFPVTRRECGQGWVTVTVTTAGTLR